jgi:hypothetical protein
MSFSSRCLGILISCIGMAIPAYATEPITGIVTVTTSETLEVKTLAGELTGFRKHVADPAAVSLASVAKGMIVRVGYTVEKDKDGRHYRYLSLPVEILGRTLTGTVKEIASDKTWVVIRTRNQVALDREINVPVFTPEKFKPLVDKMQPGDSVRATYIEDKTTLSRAVQALEWQSERIEQPWRWLSLLGAAFVLFLLAFATVGKPTNLFVGEDGRYSTSKFQTVIWFWVVISAYIAIVLHRIFASEWIYIGGVDIPQNLLLLSGISVLTFTAAKMITVSKIDQAALQGEILKPPADSRPQMRELIRNDGNQIDLGDFQMLVITILAVIIYAATAVEFMTQIEFRREVTMPDVDATLLAIFGLGQAAYLGKKAAGDTSPPTTRAEALTNSERQAFSAKSDAGRAAQAALDAKTSEVDAQKAAEAVKMATTKVAANLEVMKLVDKVKASRDAATLAATHARAVEASVAAGKKRAEPWMKLADAAMFKKHIADAQAEAINANASSLAAAKSAEMVEAIAESAKAEASSKP